jgi:hypothetical protein
MVWRQKLWYRCFSVLTSVIRQVTNASSAEDDLIQPLGALLCLCGLAAEMPFQVVQDNMAQLITFSVQALMVNDPTSAPPRAAKISKDTKEVSGSTDLEVLLDHVQKSLRHNAVQCLLASCQSTSAATLDALSPHISTLIPLLIQVNYI